MNQIFARLIMAAVLVYGAIYTWNHYHAASARPTAETHADEPELKIADPKAKPFVTVTGPLADLVLDQKPPQEEEVQKAVRYRPSVKDHIEDSPVGTSSRVLHRTFPVAHLVHVAFEIPARAVTPRFHGTFSSYVQRGAVPSHDEEANVDLLLMNEQQYTAFAAGHDLDVLFIADSSHYREINFDLPPSSDVPVRYHLVFRNSPGGAARKLVQADFTVDF